MNTGWFWEYCVLILLLVIAAENQPAWFFWGVFIVVNVWAGRRRLP